MENIPLFEFDEDRQGIIEPSKLYQRGTLPEYCVLPFYGSLIEHLATQGRAAKVYSISTCGVPLMALDVYKIDYQGQSVAVAFPGIGAPLCVGTMEELVALGCRKIVACGSGGVLKPELKRGTIIIPRSAIREEGTSYHYLPASRTIEMEPDVVSKLETVLKKHHVDYEIGKTWTTDALYRETKGKIARRKEEGCLMVEMECAGLLAAAKFRDIKFGQYIGAGDDISGDEWDPRYVDDRLSFQEKIFWLSVEAVLSL